MPSTLSDVLAFPPISESIISNLEIPDLCALRGSCQSIRRDIPLGLWARQRLDAQLSHFFPNPHHFRDRMGLYKGLITGQFALNFFVSLCERTPYIDIFIESGFNSTAFSKYLRDEQHYDVQQGQEQQIDGNGQRQTVTILASSTHDGAVRLTETAGIPREAVLNSAYTTADVNFISRDTAYSIFPSLTILQEKFYPLRKMNEAFGRVLAEHAELGWTSRNMMWPDLRRQDPRGMGPRRAGDGFTLAVRFNDADTFQYPDDNLDPVIEYSQFEARTMTPINNIERLTQTLAQLRSRPQGQVTQPAQPIRFPSQPQATHEYSINVKTVHSEALSHPQTAAIPSWREYLSARLDRWLYVELSKMGPHFRPANFMTSFAPSQFRIRLPANFVPSDDWDYADDQVPVWYQEWETLEQSRAAATG